MEKTPYNFEKPEIQQKALSKARLSTRPHIYNSKRKRVQAVQKELIKEELLKAGFLQQIGAVLPQINEALIASASQPTSSGASDRKIIYTALNILGKDKESEPQQSIGEVLAQLAKTP